MSDFQRIYEQDAERYHTLVSAEDAAGELPRALARVVHLPGARAIEVGMGTGRVTRLLLDAGASVTGYERSAAMLEVARRELGTRCRMLLADMRGLRIPPASAELALAGWALGHFCEWYADEWQRAIDGVLSALWDALAAGGTLIVIETLGTGAPAPAAPDAALARYYDFLEGAWQMRREVLRTDYRFESVAAAKESIGFFFGPALAATVEREGWSVVPEWTGLWWRRK
jgi:SAM-dependent methyltransferase